MLIDVAISNHLSIYARQSLSMYRETRSRKFAEKQSWVRPDILPVVAIYGANSAGKTSLVRGIGFIREAVSNSYREWAIDGGVERFPFALNSRGRNEVSEFDIEFIAADGYEYRFGFSVDDHVVVSEYLHQYRTKRKTVLYERELGEIVFGDSFRGPAAQIWSTTRPNSLFISAAAAGGNASTAEAFGWLASDLQVYAAAGYMAEHRKVAKRIQDDSRFRDQILAFLGNADLGVTEIDTAREELDAEHLAYLKQAVDGATGLNVDDVVADLETTLVLTHRGRDGGVVLPFDVESDGTHALISFASVAISALESGAVCIVDEIDTSLHPLLVAELVRVFADPRVNRKQAQLIFTTHDVSLMRPSFDIDPALSRESIWVVEKDRFGASSLIALSEYGPRTGENLERAYLTGRFGGLPTLSITDALLALSDDS